MKRRTQRKVEKLRNGNLCAAMAGLRFSAERALGLIARASLRQGITAHQLAHWVNAAFVRAAVKMLQDQGAEPSFSRIAALTGIHRHAVSALLRADDEYPDGLPAQKEYQRNRLARVLTGWFEDPSYTDRSGRPLALPLDGAPPSFVELVRAYSGDIYPGIILEELLRVGAIRKRPDGRVEAVSRRYTSGGADEEALRHAGVVAGDILATLEHNMRATAEARRFEDASIALELPTDAIPLLARLLERRGAAFLDDLEGWLNAAEKAGGSSRDRVRAGVRVIMIVDDATDSDD